MARGGRPGDTRGQTWIASVRVWRTSAAQIAGAGPRWKEAQVGWSRRARVRRHRPIHSIVTAHPQREARVEPLDPEVTIRQVAHLPADLRERTPLFDECVHTLLPPSGWARIDHVFLTGDGDSYHSSCAAEMAFETLAGIPCEPISATVSCTTAPCPRPLPSARAARLCSSPRPPPARPRRSSRPSSTPESTEHSPSRSPPHRTAPSPRWPTMPSSSTCRTWSALPASAPTRPACSACCSPPSALPKPAPLPVLQTGCARN